MKGIWIEKLGELLREYSYKNHDYHWALYVSWKVEWSVAWTDHDISNEEMWMVIKSKEYWFIKWLVENDKIDRDEIIINSDFMPIAFDRKWEKYEWSEEKQLLMLLSISDTPIEDLISYLK
jgi:hypothetical protein